MEIEQVTSDGKVAGGGSCDGGNWMAGVSNGEEEAGSVYLAWEDLTVVLPNFGNGPTRRLLNGLNGYAEPGRIMAIMGPSGSGKSTLLDSLAGRLSGNVVMTGNVLLNGKKKRSDSRDVAYVTQENTLLGTLTVRETINYSAHLRLPSSMTNKEIDGIVEEIIMEMGLLFLDEPTSGLDSASAFFVIQTLRNIARDGRTVISSIHQPSSEVFALFDDLFLLSVLCSLLKPDFHVQVKQILPIISCAGEPKLEGEVVLKTMLGINVDYSKWWDLTAVVAILIVSRLLFYAILKFKERTLLMFRTLYAKRTIRHLKKRASFRKNSPFPSKRHQPIHALSSQEGLNSPLHH